MENDASAQNSNLHVICLFDRGRTSVRQEGEESGTHRGAKDGSRRKRPRDVEAY